MPGHKGTPPPGGAFLDWAYDVTEVGNLGPSSDRTDPIYRSEQAMAEYFGSRRTRYSVQGATLPVTAAILASAPPESQILVDRNAHRSVLSALIIGGYRPVWIYPEWLDGSVALPAGWDIMVKASDERHAAAVLTSPTYEGLTDWDPEGMATLQRSGAIVVVDEAHGTHFFGRRGYPRSALALGADLVAHGPHKTEGVLTQTGLLHRVTERVSEDAVDFWWRLLQTSSPSYLLLASLDRLQGERNAKSADILWEEMAEKARGLWEAFALEAVDVLQAWWERGGKRADPAKLTLLGEGMELKNILQSVGPIEKADATSVTLILGPTQNLSLLKKLIPRLKPFVRPIRGLRQPMVRLPQIYAPRFVWGRPKTLVPLRDAIGRIAAYPVTPYPPGVPVIMPGEMVNREVIDWIDIWDRGKWGIMEGIHHSGGGQHIWVLD